MREAGFRDRPGFVFLCTKQMPARVELCFPRIAMKVSLSMGLFCRRLFFDLLLSVLDIRFAHSDVGVDGGGFEGFVFADMK